MNDAHPADDALSADDALPVGNGPPTDSSGLPADSSGLPMDNGILVITGTGTGVGKTVVTAAIAALAAAKGKRVAVLKPAQTGVSAIRREWESPQSVRHTNGWLGSSDDLASDTPGAADPPDIDTVTRLSGITDTHELVRYPDPLSPEAAARVAGLPPLDMRAAAEYAATLAADRDLVLVEGAGGLLVRYDPAGSTIADLAAELDAPVVVVVSAGLGTLNHTTLTGEALAARKITTKGIVVGSWPRHPDLAERTNLTDLETVTGQPLAGILPENAGQLGRHAFLATARDALVPRLGGARPDGHLKKDQKPSTRVLPAGRQR